MLLLAAGYGLWRCQRTYTPDKWASAPDERLDILGDLLERYDLVGMTEEEVVALLGPEDGPEQTSFKGDRTYYPPEDTLVYYLGVDDGRRVADPLPGGGRGDRVYHRRHLTGKFIRPTCLFHSDVLSSAQDGTPSSEQMTS